MKSYPMNMKTNCRPLSIDTGREQIPTRSGTAQSSIGSTKEKEKSVIKTTTEAFASRM
jgi:hypothetical protein